MLQLIREADFVPVEVVPQEDRPAPRIGRPGRRHSKSDGLPVQGGLDCGHPVGDALDRSLRSAGWRPGFAHGSRLLLVPGEERTVRPHGRETGAGASEIDGDRDLLFYHQRIMAGQPIVVLTGPTAVGKTALGVAAAEVLNAEIVSADSRQIYRYLDVGTGKPTAAERVQALHWLIDVAYPDQPFSIVDFQRGAEHALADVHARGKLPVIVGGSPHYLSALVDGLEPPPVNLKLRRWLERADQSASDRVDAWLRALDPIAAANIEPRNRRRVIRAVEATLAAGRPFSSVGTRRPRENVLWIGLRLDRDALRQRVATRVQGMIERGWLAEVRMLRAMGYSPDLPALSATGYPELLSVIRGELDLESAIQKIVFATHAFIRRQETWLRRDERIHWLDSDSPTLIADFVALVRRGAAPA